MNGNEIIFWLIFSLVANTYLFLFLLRLWPQLKFTAYIMNIGAMSMCGFHLSLGQPHLAWTGVFLLNLVFQNALLVHPKGTS